MSLISLLIALMAERHLSLSVWQFNHYYRMYLTWWKKIDKQANFLQNETKTLAVIVLPIAIVGLLMEFIDDGILKFLLSTLILIVCFGCVKSRDAYKCFLRSAFRGEMTTCEMNRQQLLKEKGLEDQGFGQSLVWLNYRYYIAIMLFFVAFGAAGAVFYRLLTTLVEQNHDDEITISDGVLKSCKQVLAVIDWLPVRITAFGYMFVGHFSKALPTWLESLFNFTSTPNQILISVAKVAEDYSIDDDDCTAEPCLLVRLAKRTLLLLLAVISALTILGVVN
ncbi:MAG: regulatory signaling modulator protein AmpE [Gammaproteobacteria bacterium]|nr:MAG: regulatory signaling modulator protein AmpE [Gammaproteobacteria bacterium]